MSKRSFEYPEGVYVYQHRTRLDENDEPLVLTADARTKVLIDPETQQPRIDQATGKPMLAYANLYGFELHRQLGSEPQNWEEVGHKSTPEQEAPRSRASIRQRPTGPTPEPDPAPTPEPAEQEPAEK